MVIIDKTKNEFACSFYGRIEEREKDKIKCYNDLKKEKKIWRIERE